MADYSRYGTPAPEWVEFEKFFETIRVIPPANASVQEVRDMNNARRADFHKKFYRTPDDVTIDPISIPSSDGASIPARLYRPKTVINSPEHAAVPSRLPLYIFLHGGGWQQGNLETEEPYCMHLCSTFSENGFELAVLNVNYRHTPEHIFPTQPDDAWAAFQLFAGAESGVAARYGIDQTRIVVGGVSAGAGLSIGIAMREMRRLQREPRNPDAASQESRIRGLILLSPPTVHPDLFPFHLIKSRDVSSFVQCETDFLLPTSRVKELYNMYIVPSDEASKAHEFISPLLCPEDTWDKTCWPPTTLYISGVDPLRDEALLFAEKLERVGINEVKVEIYGGYGHALTMFPNLVEGKKLAARAEEDLKRYLFK